MSGEVRVALRVAGVDEVGRGPLAGPVVAAAVILRPDRPIAGLADSKTLSPAKRERLAQQIRDNAWAWAIASADVAEIDRMNILAATLLAMRRAAAQLLPAPDLLLIDGNHAPSEVPCAVRTVIGGDALEPAISAASIVAKVWRDAYMVDLDRQFPGYGFARHKGYGTAEHLRALTLLGPCAHHRYSFAPVREAALRIELRNTTVRAEPQGEMR